MLAGLVPLLAVVAGVTSLVTRRALRPVEGIRGEMAAITASTDLSRRVPEPATHDEVARLARTTNETLTALEKSVERQRRFVADASHELRSPIASLRTQLEVAAAHPELLDLDGAVADTVRLQHLAADLLLLARLDAGEEPLGKPVALGALVRETVERRSAEGQESAGPGRGVAVVAGELADATVAGFTQPTGARPRQPAEQRGTARRRPGRRQRAPRGGVGGAGGRGRRRGRAGWRTGSGSSSGSCALMTPVAATRAARAWAWRSSGTWSYATGGRSASARRRAAGRCSPYGCR